MELMGCEIPTVLYMMSTIAKKGKRSCLFCQEPVPVVLCNVNNLSKFQRFLATFFFFFFLCNFHRFYAKLALDVDFWDYLHNLGDIFCSFD